jgi:acyl-CoA reductase-like NAD-dependent aldehyde dehydrogenase
MNSQGDPLTATDPGLPLGGFKEPGIGRKCGYEGLSAYTELQTISLAPSG